MWHYQVPPPAPPLSAECQYQSQLAPAECNTCIFDSFFFIGSYSELYIYIFVIQLENKYIRRCQLSAQG